MQNKKENMWYFIGTWITNVSKFKTIHKYIFLFCKLVLLWASCITISHHVKWWACAVYVYRSHRNKQNVKAPRVMRLTQRDSLSFSLFRSVSLRVCILYMTAEWFFFSFFSFNIIFIFVVLPMTEYIYLQTEACGVDNHFVKSRFHRVETDKKKRKKQNPWYEYITNNSAIWIWTIRDGNIKIKTNACRYWLNSKYWIRNDSKKTKNCCQQAIRLLSA